jgi:outer membrane protein assembly factor BamA
MQPNLVIAFVFSCITSVSCIAKNLTPTDTVRNNRNLKFLIVPVLFKSIETNWAIGISGSVSFKTTHANDTLTRTSSIQSVALFTQRNQNIQVLDATIYFPKEKYILTVQTSHSYFPDKFWGIGAHTKNTKYENYEYSQVYFLSQLKRKIRKSLFAGVIYEYQNIYHLKYEKYNLFDSSMLYGKVQHAVTGLGASISYDTRNSSFWPTKGVFIQYTYRAAIKSFLNSSYTNLKTILDIRYFKKIDTKAIIAFQLFNLSNFRETPIRELAMIGGAYNLRGFYQGRFRDLKMTTFIAELRFPVYKKFSACVFNGAGYIYNTLSNLNFNKLKISYGTGIRYSIRKDEKFNIRIDYGFSDKYNKGLYFTLGECF